MKNKFIWLPVALLAVVVVGAAVWFGNTATQKGSLQKKSFRATAGMPDLEVTLDEGYVATFTIKNIGTAPAQPFYYYVVRTHPIVNVGNPAPRVELKQYGAPLNPGESFGDSPEGDIYTDGAAIIVDPTNLVAESTEKNNTLVWFKKTLPPLSSSGTFNTSGVPDLIPIKGPNATFMIKNIGTAPAQPFYYYVVRTYSKKKGRPPSVKLESYVKSLGDGKSFSFVTPPDEDGSVTTAIIVDPTNLVIEENEGNNTLLWLQNPPPPLRRPVF